MRSRTSISCCGIVGYVLTVARTKPIGTAAMLAARNDFDAGLWIGEVVGVPSTEGQDHHSHACASLKSGPGSFNRLASGHRSLDDLYEFGEIGVSRRTLWRWRKVMIEALGDDEPRRLKGIVEVDETFFRDSFKGSRGWKRGNPPAPRAPRRRGKSTKRGLSTDQVPVVTAIDRHGASLKQVVRSRSDIGEALQDRVEAGSVLCIDGLAVYRNVARDTVAAAHVVVTKKSKPALNQSMSGRFSLARVYAMHNQLKAFVNWSARGVSTRYLQGYLKWIEAVRMPVVSECLVLFTAKMKNFNT